MKKQLLYLLLSVFICLNLTAQYGVSGIYTDYQSFWASSSSIMNPVRPDNRHHLLAFTWNGTTFSTGVNDQRLTDNTVGFVPKDFRAFPIGAISSASDTYVALGQMHDGANNGASTPAPFTTPATSGILASYLTDGIRGLDLGTGVSNIAAGYLRFTLSSVGISPGAINDNVPDVVVTQFAAPHASAVDSIYFVNTAGAVVGNRLAVNHNAVPISGKWMGDFYYPSGTLFLTNTEKDIRLWAADLTSFGIDLTNVTTATALVYKLNGTSDVAFVAFNVPSISVATKLELTTQPSSTLAPNCCNSTGTTALTQAPVIQVKDAAGNNISQAGIPVTVSIASGPVGHGALSGTLTANTNSAGQVVFSNVILPCNEGIYTLTFSSSIIEPATSNNISVARQQYFVKPGSQNALSTLTSWSSAIDGSGVVPADFGAGKEFVINDNTSTTYYTGGNWTITGQLIIPAGKTLKISAGTITTASCDITNAGIISGEAASTLVLNGTTKQYLGGINQLFNLSIQNAAGVDITGNTSTDGTIHLANGMVTITSSLLTIKGAVTKASGVINATSINSEVAFQGGILQQLTDGSLGTVIANLTINNAADVQLGSSITVSNQLRLTSGRLKLNQYHLTVANVVGGSPTAYIMTDGAGRTITTITGSGGSRLVPVGNAFYNPVTITNDNPTSDQFTTGVMNEMLTDGASGTIMSQSRIQTSWNIQKTGANTGSGFRLLLGWDLAQSTAVATPSLYAYEGGWTKQTTGTQSFPGTNSYGYSGYSGSAVYFGILDNAMLLPLEWKSFTATVENHQASLRWQTSNEQHTLHFIVLRSQDATTWSEIGRVTATGNSQSTLSYNFKDAAPLRGTGYYRLKQTDVDGRFTYSDTRAVKFASSAGFTILGNPSTAATFAVKIDAADQFSMFDVAGKLLWRKNLQPGIHKISTTGLITGTYYIRSSSASAQLIITN
jgi:hypothetical protein